LAEWWLPLRLRRRAVDQNRVGRRALSGRKRKQISRDKAGKQIRLATAKVVRREQWRSMQENAVSDFLEKGR
jgi:hypothetical protein